MGQLFEQCCWANLANQVRHRAHDRSKVSRWKFISHSQWESAQATTFFFSKNVAWQNCSKSFPVYHQAYSCFTHLVFIYWDRRHLSLMWAECDPGERVYTLCRGQRVHMGCVLSLWGHLGLSRTSLWEAQSWNLTDPWKDGSRPPQGPESVLLDRKCNLCKCKVLTHI